MNGSARARAAPPCAGVPRGQFEARKRSLLCVLWWALVDVVVPLLRANFYVSESEAFKQQVFYYRQVRVW
jgi:hypothetical protein